MNLESHSVPGPVERAVEGLWVRGYASQDVALSSSAFGLLEGACRLVYEDRSGSRLTLGGSTSPGALRRALGNFFCWTGSPWHPGKTPSVREVSVRLHRAFTQERVERAYLVPLDRLCLEDRSSPASDLVSYVRFGPNEIRYLELSELARRVPIEALARFGPRHEFPLGDLDGFYWLLTTQSEIAGPVHRRTLLGLFARKLSDIGSVRVFGPTFPPPIENALFVLLLTLLKDPGDVPWRPFRVPWVFSFTSDDFADSVSPPDVSALSRTMEGDWGREVEVPDQSERCDMGARRQGSLREWWTKLDALLACANTDVANFHPLTRHFFVKALTDNGVDELISNISCLEATLMLEERGGKAKLMKRFERLVEHPVAKQWVQDAYDSRNGYLHSLAGPETRVDWEDLAQARWAVGMAVREYVVLASHHPELSRASLLESLDP